MHQDILDQKTIDNKASIAPEGPPSKVSVLLVEDESLIAEIISEALSDCGYSVHTVSNALDALTHLAAGSQVDLLFTDINLPGNIDGSDLAQRARVIHPELPVIYASGRWSRLEELRSAPHSAILPKPYSPARACSVVQQLTSAAPAKRAKEIALSL